GEEDSNKRRRIVAAGSSSQSISCLSDLPSGILAHAASFLAAPSKALFAVALDGNSAVSSNERSSAIVGNQWSILDFGDIEKKLAEELNDDDISAVLMCIDAVNKVKRLKLTNCTKINGAGLEPLRGSLIIEQIDLSLVSEHQSPSISPEPSISCDIVLPILDSIIESTKHFQFPMKWRNRSIDSEFGAFLRRCNQMWRNRDTPLCLECEEEVPLNDIAWFIENLNGCGIQRNTCCVCLKHYCVDCMSDDVDNMFMIDLCDACDRYYCMECSRVEFCEICGSGDVDKVHFCKLFNASKRGDLAKVKTLCESGVDVIGSRQDNGMSSILFACQNGHVDLMDYLLEQGANPNDAENYGGTCLMAAACRRHPDCVRRLIDEGADVEYAYPGDNASIIGMTAYCFSKDDDEGNLDFEEGSVIRMVELLLEAGAPANTPQIDHETGRTETALQVLQGMLPSDDKVRRERDGLIALLQRDEES
ncbi:ankyrin repeat domain-containing protein, partial [Skeletonema marinoi]